MISHPKQKGIIVTARAANCWRDITVASGAKASEGPRVSFNLVPLRLERERRDDFPSRKGPLKRVIKRLRYRNSKYRLMRESLKQFHLHKRRFNPFKSSRLTF